MLFYIIHIFIIILFFAIWYYFHLENNKRLIYYNINTIKSEGNSFIINISIFAFLIRFLSMIIIMISFPEMYDIINTPYSAYDHLTYHTDAQSMASIWEGKYNPTTRLVYSDRYKGYPLFLSIVYYIFGPYYIYGAIFNNMFGVITIILTYKIGVLLYDEYTGRQGAFLLTIYPLHIYICSFTLKDPLLILLITFIIYLMLKINYNSYKLLNKLIVYLLILTSCFIIFFMRQQTVFLILIVILIYQGLYYRKNKKDILIILPLIILLINVLIISSNTSSINDIINNLINENIIEYQQKKLISMKSMRDDIFKNIYIIFGILGYILPFPSLALIDYYNSSQWQIESSIFIWNILGGLSLLGIYYSIKNNWKTTWIIWSFPILYFYSQLFFYPNAILDMRRSKLMIMPFVCILAAYGLKNFKIKSRIIYFTIYIYLVLIGSIAYTYLRLKGHSIY